MQVNFAGVRDFRKTRDAQQYRDNDAQGAHLVMPEGEGKRTFAFTTERHIAQAQEIDTAYFRRCRNAGADHTALEAARKKYQQDVFKLIREIQAEESLALATK